MYLYRMKYIRIASVLISFYDLTPWKMFLLELKDMVMVKWM